METPPSDIFRAEALEYHSQARQAEAGEPLHISPAWAYWSYWLLVSVVIVGGLYVGLAHVHEYADGPAIIQQEGRTELVAEQAGFVSQIAVRPGARVTQGKLLLSVLPSPEQKGMGPMIEGSLDEMVRAPHAGVVTALRVRPGQHVTAGESLLSLIDDESPLSVIALLPGHDRPLLKLGMTLRVELSGYRYTYQNLTIQSIDDVVLGPREAQRYLGDEMADIIPIQRPVVAVRARLPSRDFTTRGRTFRYYDGMYGQARVRIRSERLLFTWLPALANLF